MSAPKVIAQAANLPLIAFPTWKVPVLIHLKATIGGGAGVATLVTDQDATTGAVGSTPGVAIARNAAGIYDITFDPCRSIALGTVSIMLGTATGGFAVAAELRQGMFDRLAANTSAKLGKLRIGFPTNAGLAPTELLDNSEIHVSFWADFG